MALNKPKVVTFFYAKDVSRLSGLSEHMIDYVCRHGLVVPSASRERGFGKRRRFTFTDILLTKSIATLLAADVSVLNMRKSLSTLRDLLQSKSGATLTDKRIIIRAGIPFLSEPGQPPVDLTARGQMAFCFVLEVEQMWKHAESIWMRREAAARKRVLRALERRDRRIA